MQPLQYKTTINATPQIVWDALWNKNSYTIWASVFSHGTNAIGDFRMDATYQFLNIDGNGLHGIIDTYAEPNEIIFNHLGEINTFEKNLDAESIKNFENVSEHYVLENVNNQTLLTATIRGMNNFQSYFDETFPMALENLKTIAEHQLICIDIYTNQATDKVWQYWTEPNHIMQWNQASPDWHCPNAVNDLTIDGKFSSTMAAKDSSFSFEFGGIYSEIEADKKISYTMDDGRIANILFVKMQNGTRVIQAFEPEKENTIEIQKGGWQAIMDSFKNYVENN